MQRKPNLFVFQPERYYKHSGGGMIHTLHYLRTYSYGIALIAEDKTGRLWPVGSDPTNSVNYGEITKEEFENSTSEDFSSQSLLYDALRGEAQDDAS